MTRRSFPFSSTFSSFSSKLQGKLALGRQKFTLMVTNNRYKCTLIYSEVKCCFCVLFFMTGSSQVICGNISRALKSRRKVCELLESERFNALSRFLPAQNIHMGNPM